MTNVYLIGYRCCGKSSAGRLLAARLGWSFVDTDEQVAARAGQTITALVSRRGWEHFRKLERACLADIAGAKGLVVATGGGVIVDSQNIAAMKTTGVVVWLTASAGVIRARMYGDAQTADQRPALTACDTHHEIESVLAERTPFYRAASDIVVDTDRETLSTLVEILMDRLRLLGIKPDRRTKSRIDADHGHP